MIDSLIAWVPAANHDVTTMYVYVSSLLDPGFGSGTPGPIADMAWLSL